MYEIAIICLEIMHIVRDMFVYYPEVQISMDILSFRFVLYNTYRCIILCKVFGVLKEKSRLKKP